MLDARRREALGKRAAADAASFGYVNASWTLRADLMGDFVVKLLQHMDAQGLSKVEVELGPDEQALDPLPFVDPDDFNPGYIQRGAHLLPRSLDKPEWRHSQNYAQAVKVFPTISVEETPFAYS